MSIKKSIKEIIEKDYGKKDNYNKIITKALGKGQKRMKNFFKYCLVPVTSILVICGIFFINKDNKLLDLVIDEDSKLIYINDYKQLVTTKFDADIKEENFNDIKKEFSFVNNLNIIKDFKIRSHYGLYVKELRNGIKSSDYNVLNNYVLVYESDDSNSKKIILSFSKDLKPLRDYDFLYGNLKMSQINNTEVTVTKYEDSYIAIFQHNNINFDIETYGISEDDFIDLLASIIR